MSKIISYNLDKQKAGIDKIVDAMKITIGPRGKNVSLSNGDTVNDGRRIAEDITLKDFTENKGADRVKRLVRKISADVGGGRTACGILYQNLVDTGSNLLSRGFNANSLKKGMLLAVKDITEQLDKMSKPAKGHLKQIATISTESEELGKVITEIMEKIGKDGIVTVEESQSFGISTEMAEGLKFDKGWASPYLVTNQDKLEAEYKDIPVLIMDKKISFTSEIESVIQSLIQKKKKELLIIADDIDDSVLKGLAFLKYNSIFNTLAIRMPGLGNNKQFCIEDLCALTGAEVWLDITKAPKLGIAKKIKSTKDFSIILGGNVSSWLVSLQTRKDMTENPWEKDQFAERIAKLQNGIAVIKVGASSEDEVKYLKLKIEDGVNETKRALEEGIVMGGNVAFIKALKMTNFEFLKDTPIDVVHGYTIVAQSIKSPLRNIVENSDGLPDVIINEIAQTDSLTSGYNALDNTIVDDMYKEGIIDATKVVKTVLQYAVNEAILFLSLGADISEEVNEGKT